MSDPEVPPAGSQHAVPPAAPSASPGTAATPATSAAPPVLPTTPPVIDTEQAHLTDGVNRDTVWTWNAIGKRRGAWGLATDAEEGNRGFLLNHAIGDELLPDAQGKRYSNSDPVTGQAAWFDLRVRLRRCAPQDWGETAPLAPPLARPVGLPPSPDKLAYGAQFKAKEPA